MNHLQTKVETLGQATESTSAFRTDHCHRTATFQGISRQRTHLPAMVLGVRVHGPDVVDVEVKLDETFRSVPVPEKLGIPVLYKTQSGTGGAAIICDLKIEMHQMPIGTHGTHSIFHFVVLLKRISKHCNLLRRPAPLLGFAELKSDSLYIYYIVTSCQQGLMIPLVLAVNSTFLNAQIPHCFWDIYI